jgi:tetratricopeptide (TPR) repeat protein
LIIFDNADDPNLDLAQFFPKLYRGIILITTRLRTLGELATIHHLQIGEMSHDEAVETLVKAARQTPPLTSQDVQAIDTLVRELGYLALALVQAGTYIFNIGLIEAEALHGSVFGQYLDLFHKEQASLMRGQRTKSLDNYTRGVYPSLDLSYKLLPQFAREFLHLCSQFYYTNVPLSMLVGAVKRDFKDSDGYLERFENHEEIQQNLRRLFLPDGVFDELYIRGMIQTLSSFSLVQTTVVNDTVLLRFHPLVHAWSYEKLSPQLCSIYNRMAMAMISSSVTSLPQEHIQYLPPHITRVMTRANSAVVQVRDMLNFGDIMVNHGFWRMGVELHEEAVKKIEQAVDTDDMQKFKGYIHLGNSYRKLGRLREAEALGTKMSAIIQEIPEEKHFKIVAYNYIASIYSDLGKLKEAEELQTMALAMCHGILGERDQDTISVSSNLADIFRSLGKLKEAEELQTKVLVLRREILGARHPDTISASDNLAITYSSLGKLKEAEELQTNALSMRQEILGERHPDTLKTCNNLASTYHRLGELSKAEELRINVLKMQMEVLGERNLRTIDASHNLACTYAALGKLKEAEQMQTSVVAMRREILGEKHPNTISSSNNLATYYLALGNLKAAKELGIHVLAMCHETLGERHLDTIDAYNNLASTYSELGRHKEAQKMQTKVLAMRREILGERHPDTISASNNLAITYRRIGKRREAEELQTKVLAMQREMFGERNPDTISASENLSLTYFQLGKLKEAEELQVGVLARRREIFGDRNPDTIRACSNLAMTYRRLGRLTEADSLIRTAYELAIIVLGPDHPMSSRVTLGLKMIQADVKSSNRKLFNKRDKEKQSPFSISHIFSRSTPSFSE